MNAFRPTASTAARTADRAAVVVPFAPRNARPERDFGVGYGRSSGYATSRRYASDWAPPRFRCA